MYDKKIFIPLFLSLSFSLSIATDYNNWKIYDNNPEGATITTIDNNGTQYLLFQGDKRRNSYLTGSRKSTKGWNNQNEKKLEWNMNYSEKFKISIYIQTIKGLRIIQFDYKNKDKGLYKKKYIRLGLGKKSINGTWQHFSRNLELDLQKYEPNNKILSINGFKIQGSGKISSLRLINTNQRPNNPIISKVKDVCLNQKEDKNIICLNKQNLAYYKKDINLSSDTYLYAINTKDKGEIIAKQIISSRSNVPIKNIYKLDNTPLIYTYSISNSHHDFYDFYTLDINNTIKSIDKPNFYLDTDSFKLDNIKSIDNGQKLQIEYHHIMEQNNIFRRIYTISDLANISQLP